MVSRVHDRFETWHFAHTKKWSNRTLLRYLSIVGDAFESLYWMNYCLLSGWIRCSIILRLVHHENLFYPNVHFCSFWQFRVLCCVCSSTGHRTCSYLKKNKLLCVNESICTPVTYVYNVFLTELYYL